MTITKIKSLIIFSLVLSLVVGLVGCKKYCNRYYPIRLDVTNDLQSDFIKKDESITITLQYSNEQFDREDGEQINIEKYDVKSAIYFKVHDNPSLSYTRQAFAEGALDVEILKGEKIENQNEVDRSIDLTEALALKSVFEDGKNIVQIKITPRFHETFFVYWRNANESFNSAIDLIGDEGCSERVSVFYKNTGLNNIELLENNSNITLSNQYNGLTDNNAFMVFDVR